MRHDGPDGGRGRALPGLLRSDVERLLLILSGTFGALGVVFGAFGAHGLRARLDALPDGAVRRAWWETAAHYHLIHALAIAVAAYLFSRSNSTAATVAGFSFVCGIVLFSGSLYAMTLTGVRALGAVTPFGGLLFIAGWVGVVVAAWSLR
jgi:uncharacterized membrane protein YgdD (TMEM256/DUF423 family)